MSPLATYYLPTLFEVASRAEPSIAPVAFTGDTLFCGGCGALFEASVRPLPLTLPLTLTLTLTPRPSPSPLSLRPTGGRHARLLPAAAPEAARRDAGSQPPEPPQPPQPPQPSAPSAPSAPSEPHAACGL